MSCISILLPHRADICCIQLPSDYVLEQEGPILIRLFPGVTIRMVKMDYDNNATICSSTFIKCLENGELSKKASYLESNKYNTNTVIGIACTSMSFILGPTAIRKELKYGFPSALPTDMFEAQVEALKVFRVSRVALLTPYIEEVSKKNALMLSSEANVQVVSRYTMNLSHDYMTTNVSLDTIIQHVLNINCSSAQIIVIGCSAFRICEPGLITELERIVGKPVITSTQAYLWWMLRMAGVKDRIDGYGTLFSDY